MSDGTARHYPDRPIAAGLAVCRRGERIFLARRSFGPGIGRWGFPGGMQELGETIQDCARRELLEETGVEAAPIRIISGTNAIRRDDDGRVQTHFTLVAVLLEWRGGEGAPIEDATEVGWFTLQEAESLETFPDALPMMRLAFAL